MSRLEDRPGPPAFLSLAPPHWVARGLSFILLGMALAALVTVVVVQVPERVSAPFVLAPVDGPGPLRSLHDGRVVEVNVRQGDDVPEGAPLVAIRSEWRNDEATQQRDLEARRDGAVASLENERARHASQRSADAEEEARLAERIARLAGMIDHAREQLRLHDEEEGRYQKLVAAGVASESERERRTIERSAAAISLEQLESDRAEARKQRERLLHEIAAREVEQQESERGLTEEAQRVALQLDGVAANLGEGAAPDVLRAPCAGTVLHVDVPASGAVVMEGEPVVEVACDGATLHAVLELPAGGLARLRVGQTARLLYDAFPYQRFGVRRGRLSWVGPGRAIGNGGFSFQAFVDPDDAAIKVDGQRRQLQAGMGGRAEIVVGRRRLFQYLVEPMRGLAERLGDDGRDGAAAK